MAQCSNSDPQQGFPPARHKCKFVGALANSEFPRPESLLLSECIGEPNSKRPRYKQRYLFCVLGAVVSAVLLLSVSMTERSNDTELIKKGILHLTRGVNNTDFLRGGSRGIGHEEEFRLEFDRFQLEFHKSYHSQDELNMRFQIFKTNMRRINEWNKGWHSYSMAPNQFSDLTGDEFAASVSGPIKSRVMLEQSPSMNRTLWSLLDEDPDLPSQVDWRSKGCVTDVKDQGKCGSCWAFSTTGSIEGALCAQTGVLRSLSEQQLVDCAVPQGNHGCLGGEMDLAFEYVLEAGGLCLEEAYPYVAQNGNCSASCPKIAKIRKFMDVPRKSERAMKAALAKYGPVAVAIEADQGDFQFYHSGIFDSECGKRLDHAVLIVGYGDDEESGEPYWLIKNSWGRQWGDDGYVRFGRKNHGKSGECGVLLDGSIPIVYGEPEPFLPT